MKINIIGNGEFAYAIFHLLKVKKINACLFFRNHEKYQQTLKQKSSLIFNEIKILNNEIDIIDNLSGDDITFFAANSNFIKEINLQKIKHIILCCKGFYGHETLFLSDYILLENPNMNISIISGPGFAKNIINNEKTIFTSYSKNFQEFENIFPNEFIKLEYFHCIKSIEFAGAIKNIIAIIFGYLYHKHNINQALYHFSFIMEDILLLCKNFNLNQEVLLKACGIGDILLSITKESRNYTVGKLLYLNKKKAREMIESETIEGIKSLKILQKFITNKNINAANLMKIVEEMAI